LIPRARVRFGVVLLVSLGTLSVRVGAQQTRDTLRVIYPDTIVATLVAADSTKRPLRLCAGGDITLGSNLDSAWAINAQEMLWSRFARRADPDSMLAPVRPMFEHADIVLVNIEGAIGDGPAFKKCGPKSKSCFAFRQPPAAADALRHLGNPNAHVVGNLANNHSHDAGPDGLAMTLALLDSAGVRVTGADTLATPVITERGDTLAILGFYTGGDSPDARDFAAVRRYVARAVSEFGVVIVTMHLGAEGAKAQRTKDANELFVGGNRGNPVAFAKTALAAGATAVIGHGPHVLRAGEWKDSSLVLYSLGNLVNYGTFGLGEPMNHGAVACMNIDGPRSVSAVHIESTIQIAPGVVLSDWSAGSAALIDSLSGLDFPRTGVSVSADGSIGRRPQPLSIPVRKPPR
jgi:Bacterial capsule synthesis protein PGA_cap